MQDQLLLIHASSIPEGVKDAPIWEYKGNTLGVNSWVRKSAVSQVIQQLVLSALFLELGALPQWLPQVTRYLQAPRALLVSIQLRGLSG
jgi:formate hydrogenlyase subunit 4